MAVLTIQSHVVAGHVGNSAAVFCLERSGIETWELDTLQFSNHTAAVGWTGQVFTADHLRDVVNGLEVCSGLENCEAVLSGYLGAKDVGNVVLETVERVRAKNPKAFYCCDPVMGDNDELYVAHDIPDFMREKALPQADLITPNRFELGWLSNTVVTNEETAVIAARSLIGKGRLKTVVITGLPHEGQLAALAVQAHDVYRVMTPRIDFNSSVCCGAGDITTSILIANLVKTGSITQALSIAVSAVYGLILKTVEMGEADIQLIKAQEQIVKPVQLFEAQKI